MQVESVAYFSNFSYVDFMIGQVNARACISHIVICIHHFLWHNLATERFYIRVFLLDYLPAQQTNIPNPGFKFSILLGLNYISSGLYLQTSLAWVTLTRDFCLQPVQLYWSWRHTNVSTTVRWKQ